MGLRSGVVLGGLGSYLARASAMPINLVTPVADSEMMRLRVRVGIRVRINGVVRVILRREAQGVQCEA